MTIKEIPCNPRNYNATRRDRSRVKYIVIHYTAGTKDTAENEGNYFKHNRVGASAHFFIDRAGNVVQSVNMWQTAWSVGGKKYSDCKKTGGGKYYRKCTNSNSVSIELCAIADKDASPEQIKACKELVAYIRKYCKNAKTIIRHFDVNGKHCPSRYMDSKKWKALKEAIS